MKSTSLVLIFILTAFFTGCEIQEADVPDSGYIFAAAEDASGAPIVGGTITLDGIQQGVTTPDTLNNVVVGDHLLRVKVQGFEAVEETVTVVKNQITEKLFVVDTPAQYGQLTFNLTPVDASLILDRTLIMGVPNSIQVETGSHSLSAFLNGYITDAPALDTLYVGPDDFLSYTKSLTLGAIGNTAGTVAGDFTLDDDYGNNISLHDYRGYIVMLSFFYSGCQPCMEEFPDINQAFIDYATYGVQVMGIDPMNPDTIVEVQQVRNNLNLQFTLLLDYGYSVNLQYGVIAYPTNIIIAPNGEIHALMLSTNYDDLTDIFDTLLGL